MPATHERWIDDYRSVGLVDWPPGLRDTIVHRRRAALRLILICILPQPFLLVATVVFLIGGNAYFADWLAAVMGGTLIVLMLLWISIGSLAAYKARIRRARDKRSLKAPQLELFELSQHIEEDADAAMELGITNAPLPDVLRRYVEPKTRLLLQEDTTPQDELLRVSIRTLAADATPNDGALGIRPLEPHEIDEIRALSSRAGRWLLWLPAIYLAMTVYVFLGTVAIFNRTLSIGDWLGFFITGTFWLAISKAAISPNGLPRRYLRFRAALRSDRKRGEAEMVKGHIAVAELDAKADPYDPPPEIVPELVCRLPETGRWWTFDGVPAPWRRASSPLDGTSAEQSGYIDDF